jgi:BirA family biotin operon repressor/biotin-[acetyl-CoA-carboxylase] ligase
MSVSTGTTPMTAERVRLLLRTKTLGRRLHVLDEAPSTNTVAMALAQSGAEDGTVVVADTQTAGRGRLGRPWFSPPGQNLYCSVLFRQTTQAERLSNWLSWIPLITAVAAVRAVQAAAGLQPLLKWPNDVLIRDRKLGGILCESGSSGTSDAFVVVGIGLNVNQPPDTFPPDLRDLATSIAGEIGRPIDRASLLAALLAELEPSMETLRFDTSTDIIDDYAALCATLGRRVRVTLADGKTVKGRADTVAPDGSLRIAPDNSPSALVSIRAGDVVHLR